MPANKAGQRPRSETTDRSATSTAANRKQSNNISDISEQVNVRNWVEVTTRPVSSSVLRQLSDSCRKSGISSPTCISSSAPCNNTATGMLRGKLGCARQASDRYKGYRGGYFTA